MKKHGFCRSLEYRPIRRSIKGATLAEYALLVGIVAVVAIVAILAQGEAVRDIFGDSTQTIEEAIAQPEPEVTDPYASVDQTEWLVGTKSADADLQITTEPGAMGLSGDDVIRGTGASEGFIGGPGDDTIYGGGGRGSDIFYFAKGEGHDFVSNYSNVSGGDLIKFLDAASTDVTAGRNGENLVLTIDETGDSLELERWANTYHRDWRGSFSFTDGAFRQQDMRDKADEDQKPTGYVQGSYRRDNYVVRVGDGDYTVSEPGDVSRDDNITFAGLSSEDVEFYSNQGQDLLIKLPSGETITYTDTYAGLSYRIIEAFHFTDQDMTYAESICKMNEDSKDLGVVYGSDYNDCYTFKPTDPNFSIRESSGTDTIRFTGYNVDDLKFYSNSNLDMIFSDPHGPELTVYGGFDRYSYRFIENFVFDDATLTRQQVIDKMDQDMKIPGYIWGSLSNDHYTMELDDPSYAYVDYVSTDTLSFPGMSVNEVKFFSNSDNYLEAVIPTGKSVTSVNEWFIQGTYRTSQFIFDDVTLNNSEAIAKMDVDSKERGVVYGTPFNDRFTFNGEDQNITINERGGSDTITFDKPFTEYTLYYDPDNISKNLYIKDESSNMVLTIQGQNYTSSVYAHRIETFIFTDQTMSATDVSNYCQQPNGVGGKMCDKTP